MADLVNLSAVALARGIRDRRWSPSEVVQAHIERIRAVNPSLNAVVAPRFEKAQAEAARADQRVRRSDPRDLPPLHGVPFTVKEFVGVEGMPNTGGILARSHETASEDATVVRRLREAGGIVLGMTNAPEGGLWYETSNPVYGRTSNPHDLRRTCGGSSGGEGAIVASGGSPFGIGSDAGGSVRIPAAFCGIAGHKPSVGLVPDTGHFPPGPADGDHAPMVVGPMARHVEDLELVMSLVTGPDGRDPRAGSVRWMPERASLDELTVYAVPTTGRFRPAPEVAAAVHKAARALEAQGARRAPWAGPDLSETFEIWAAMLSETAARYDEIVGSDGPPPDPWRQALRWMVGRADHSGAVIAVMLLERGAAAMPERTRRLARAAVTLRRELDRALGTHGVMVLPTYPRTATRHRAIALRSPFDAGCTALFNISGGPATSVRVDTDPRGLPIGVQLGAARGGDRLTLSAAGALETVFGAPMPIEPRWGKAAPLGIRLA